MSNHADQNLRISKTSGKIMIAVALFFDLLPIIALGIAIYISYNALSETMIGKSFNTQMEADKWCAELNNPDNGWLYTRYVAFKCGEGYAQARDQLRVGAIGVALTGVGAIFIGPLIYETISFISTILAYLLFTFWFLFNGVNIWSFSKPKKVFLNLITIIVEEIPILDLLPGTTFMVWRHIKMSQTEDKIKNNKIIQQAQNRIPVARRTAYAR